MRFEYQGKAIGRAEAKAVNKAAQQAAILEEMMTKHRALLAPMNANVELAYEAAAEVVAEAMAEAFVAGKDKDIRRGCRNAAYEATLVPCIGPHIGLRGNCPQRRKGALPGWLYCEECYRKQHRELLEVQERNRKREEERQRKRKEEREERLRTLALGALGGALVVGLVLSVQNCTPDEELLDVPDAVPALGFWSTLGTEPTASPMVTVAPLVENVSRAEYHGDVGVPPATRAHNLTRTDT